MSVVVSLLKAINKADGEALVMHVGEKPYVVTATGHADLAPKALTIPAMTGMLEQLLPADSRQALDQLGAVEYHLPPQESAPGARYSVVAARGGDDIWIEVRRRREAPAPAPEPIAVLAPEPAPEPITVVSPEPAPTPEPIIVVAAEPAPTLAPASEPITVAGPEPAPTPEPALNNPDDWATGSAATSVAAVSEPQPTFELETFRPVAVQEEAPAPDPIIVHEPVIEPIAYEPELVVADLPAPAPVVIDPPPPEPIEEPFTLIEPVVVIEEAVAAIEEPVAAIEEPVATIEEPGATTDEPVAAIVAVIEEPVVAIEQLVAAIEQPVAVVEEPVAVIEEPIAEAVTGSAAIFLSAVASAQAEVAATPATAEEPVEQPASEIDQEEEEEPAAPTPRLAAVVPLTRPSTRVESTARPRGEGLPYLLQLAAAHGASVLYVAAHAKPSLRVDGEIRVLDHETPLGEAQLESAIVAMLPQGAKVPLDEVETCDVPEVGRVQVLGFRDHRGLGAMFKMLPARAISAEQMGLGPAIQALCTETEGLVLVAGARSSGKSTLVAALVDQVNRTRRDHVITVEHQIQYVHENRTSFVSQREARDDETLAAAVRSALREGPDVLVVDHVTSAEAAIAVLHAASNGHLVIASITAPTTSAALQRFVELFGEGRGDARVTVSDYLRGVITQTLLRKTGGGRAAAREVLVNVPSVTTLVADGHFDQLSGVLNGGRRVGMVPLNDALLGLVQAGALDVREAYRKSPDQNELVSMFNRAGLDTTFAERLA